MDSRLLMAGFLIIGVLIAGCQAEQADVQSGPQPFTTDAYQQEEVSSVEFNIRASDSGYDPEEITVEKGETVTLYVTSTTEKVTRFVIEELDIDEQLVDGTKAVVVFKADKAGEFDFGDPTNSEIRPGRLVVE